MTTELTQDVLRELLHYNPETGVFTWLRRDRKWFKIERSFKRWNNIYFGTVAGSIDGQGYCLIGVLGHRYHAHRLAFLYMTGEFPENDTDHINGDKADNRWINMRAVVHSENLRNAALSCRNTSGRIGVGWYKALNKWQSQISTGGKEIHLGYFNEFEDASEARRAAEIKYGYHENHGRTA